MKRYQLTEFELEEQGFKIRLKRDAKGNWTATAMKSGKKTTVAVSSTGKVSPVK